MFLSSKISGKNIKTTLLRLGEGWSGGAVLSGVGSRNFSTADWTNCLSQPHLLFENVQKILKKEGRNCVAVRNLTVGGDQLRVVIKRHHPEPGLRQFFRSLRPGKAIRNFQTAIKLLQCGIPVATPLVALQQRQNLLTKQSIYITEYFGNASNLYMFAYGHGSRVTSHGSRVTSHGSRVTSHGSRKQLSHQLATILAMLHKNNLWHRDSKATNFIVCKDPQGKYKILLIDMDGIKPYFLRRRCRQFRSLWQLAASFIPVSAVNRTDYLRTFIAYCNLVGLEVSQRRPLFRELAGRAKKKSKIKSQISKPVLSESEG
jgi:serine/threonine protein kinase